MSKHNARFIGNTQEDAAEFLSTLICAIGIDLETKREISQIEGQENIEEIQKLLQDNGVEKWVKTLEQSIGEIKILQRNGSSDLMDLFRTQIYSEIQCNGCGFLETCFEDRIMMELDLPKDRDTTNLLKWFQKTFEKVYYGLENQNECLNWNKLTSFTRKEWIVRLPKIMIVHLKRFETNQYGMQQKNNKDIKFPTEDLDSSLMIHPYFKGCNPNYLYHLNGVSIHYGTLQGGHYIANVKNTTENGKWYDCNDSTTSKIEGPETSGSAPYVLFYLRNDIRN